MQAFEKNILKWRGTKTLKLSVWHVSFHTKNGIYAMSSNQLEVVTTSSIDWWSPYGFKTLELAKLAEKYISTNN